MNRNNDLTEDENSVSFCIHFLAISSIINKVLSYYFLLRSFTQRDLVVLHFILLQDSLLDLQICLSYVNKRRVS